MAPFDDLDRTPANHFRLHFYAAVHWLRQALPERADRVPFLAQYLDDANQVGSGKDAWLRAIARWEQAAERPLPLGALRAAAGLEPAELRLWFVCGLVEEDGRFGRIVEAFRSVEGQPYPTLGVLTAWAAEQGTDGDAVRAAVARLSRAGLLEDGDPAIPRAERPLAVWLPAWDAARGLESQQLNGWARLCPRSALVAARDFVADPEIADAVERLPAILGRDRALVVRGLRSSGRRTTIGAIARALDRGVLELRREALDPQCWRGAGALATLHRALPLLVLDLAPGESLELEPLHSADAPLAVVLGRTGSVTGAAVEAAIALELPIPGERARRRHWTAALPGITADRAADLAATHRMTGGNIRRAGALARAQAALSKRKLPADEDIRVATRTLRERLLETLAVPMPPGAPWDELALEPAVLDELRSLETRCRSRDRLRDALGPWQRAGAGGVRALLTGPSGTGKTLAARSLATQLGLELYRVDLAAVIEKYVGESEKRMARLLDVSEATDAPILLDEGDALLTQRTAVQSANDRWANLETSFLLQRLETFEGILLVTTNAGERIDTAFRRRMDAVVQLGPPQPGERLAIWQAHLPERHRVPDALLEEVAVRCELTGGEIRNATLHAVLLGLERERAVGADELRAALAREYRKSGRILPLADPAHA